MDIPGIYCEVSCTYKLVIKDQPCLDILEDNFPLLGSYAYLVHWLCSFMFQFSPFLLGMYDYIGFQTYQKNATSIERMTEQFISGLQSNYSSTISTIFRYEVGRFFPYCILLCSSFPPI